MTRKFFFCASSRAAIRTAALLFCTVLLGTTWAAEVRAAGAPAWLMAVNRTDVSGLEAGNPAVVVGEWYDFSVDATGKFVERERRAIRVLNAQSAAPFLRAVAYENTDVKATSIQAWAITNSGRVIESQKKEVETQAAYAQWELFSDDRVKVLSVAGAEDGALVGYEIVSSGRYPLDCESFVLEGPLPVRLGEVHVSVPAGTFHWFANYVDRVRVTGQSATEATFHMENRPAILTEAGMPPVTSLAASVFINYDPKGTAAAQSWEDVGRFIHPLLSGPEEEPGPAIGTEVDTLSAGQPDRLSKLNAAYTFVSHEVRYVAVEIGIGGWEPHAAADVFKNRYGDCKDKATLLLAMLDHLGLRGYPALVGTRSDIEADPKTPTLATFDHMIVALPVTADLQPFVKNFPSYDPAEQILWIDPTSETAPLGQLPEMDQGVFALVSYPDHGDLERIPEASVEQNGVEYQATLKLGPDGQGVAAVQDEVLGSLGDERREIYRAASNDRLRKIFEDRVARVANQVTFQQASVSVDNKSGVVDEKFSFSGHFATASMGDSWFFQPLFLSGLSMPEISPQPRHLPLELGPPYRLRGAYRIELPANMRVASVPEKTAVQSEFGSLEVEYSVKENVLITTETLSFTLSRIPPEKYEAFREFVNNARRVGQVRLRAVQATQ